MSTSTKTPTFDSRLDIPTEYKWDLTPIFETVQDWEESKKEIKKDLKDISQFKGKVMNSPKNLGDTLTFTTALQEKLRKLSCYASLSSDEDMRVSQYQGMKQEVSQIYSAFAAAASYIEPEILDADVTTIRQYIQEDERLRDFDFYLEDLIRQRRHKRSDEVEKVIAQASLMAGNASSIYSIFSNADFPYPEVTLSDGNTVTLNNANFALYRTSPVRDDRKKVFESFMTTLSGFERTFGTQLYGNLKKDVFYSRVRNYNNTLESSLDEDHIPEEVYHNLISNVQKNLSTFHRYLRLRKRMMGLDKLHYFDLYAPLVDNVDLKYSVDEAQEIVLKSLAPLGQDYVNVVEKSFEDRWIDMYPNKGKRSGAYSNGAIYDTHPYILMNYNGKYDDVSTLTHELGHTMHSYLSNKKQPFAKADYSIFVAEVASTLNEELLNDYLLDTITDPQVRLSILGNYLEGAKGTLFRQTQFAEYELLIHQITEKGESLTGEKLSELYLDLVRKYYGHQEEVCHVDENIRMEWAYIPHFYYDYYVYQYATSFTASQALAEKVLSGDPNALERYLTFLSSGGSEYPVRLLKKAGVDMTESRPFQLTIQKINRIMDEMEEILADG
ncbi:oligoendopeptidase F [Membranicola marinus]|uniref:Oligopeptidase F n=1 Tax=Membranihabitans marinus TaxID=1227546 RepID=A0A953HTJ8_9BACT|nr:oligoendopeptidase F [Membranihabitans marinus]MBY5958075.1 oligoendopeptidase F [Membranihabitans marinus]